MRRWFTCLGIVLLQVGWAQSATKPDVVLVTIDTLRHDHVGCFGAKPSPTPNLDRFCRDSLRYTQAVTVSPITTPSHVSILTGLLTSHHGVSDFGVPLEASKATLAQTLKSRGYTTSAFIGAVVLDSHSLAPGLDRGFDAYDNFPARGGKGHWDVLERRAATVVDHASAWLRKNQQTPRFVWVHLYDPHDPYEAPVDFAGKTGSAYDDEVGYADSQLGRLFELLKLQKRYDSSLIIVMADHGEGLGEHKENTHGIFLYDSTLRVPLIIKLPRNESSGTAVDRQVSSVDVMPTILDVAGIAVPAGLDGRSVLDAARPSDGVAIAETDYPRRFGWAPIKAARTSTKKYIHAPRPETYDLSSDPRETNNEYAPWSPAVQRLREVLAQRTQESGERQQSSVPQSTVDELRALGYLGNVVGATTAADLTTLPDPKDKIEVQNHIHTGMMLEERGGLDGAIDSFSSALRLDPQSGMILAELGEAELKAGRWGEAANHLSAARKQSPQDANLALHAGEAFYKNGNLAEATTALQEGLSKLPDSYEARVMLADVYAKQNNDAGAEDQLQAAVLADPIRAEARIALAQLYLKAGKKNEAQHELRLVLRYHPQNQMAKKLLSSNALSKH